MIGAAETEVSDYRAWLTTAISEADRLQGLIDSGRADLHSLISHVSPESSHILDSVILI